MRSLLVYIPKSLHADIKMYAAKIDVPMRVVVIEALCSYLKKREPKKCG